MVAGIIRGVGDIRFATQKIDGPWTVDGLLGIEGSLAYIIEEIDTHLHSYESWFERATTPSGETHVADRLGLGIGSFQIDAGDNDWGEWVLILGSLDTPSRDEMTHYDMNKITISAAEKASAYYIQVGFDPTPMGSLVTGCYSEFVFVPQSVQGKAAPITFQGKRNISGLKAWARCKCPGQVSGTLDFFTGIHEYPG